MNVREWALPVYTILIQLACGALLALWILRTGLVSKDEQIRERLVRIPVLIIFSTVFLGMVGAHFHLSKPLYSFYAVRNFAHSWLSREVVATAVLFFTVGSLTALLWLVKGHYRLKNVLGWVGSLMGLVTVFCMAHIYLLPTQIAWNSNITIATYFCEAMLLGSISLAVILLMDLNFSHELDADWAKMHEAFVKKALPLLSIATLVGFVLTMSLTYVEIDGLQEAQTATTIASLNLLQDVYFPLFLARVAFSVAGVLWLLYSLWNARRSQLATRRLIAPWYLACVLLLVGEILSRFLFYAVHVRVGI